MKEFLESYPLYKKYNPGWCGEDYAHSRKTFRNLPKPAINMFCDVCGSVQTYNFSNEYYEHHIFAAYPKFDEVFREISLVELEDRVRGKYVKERTVKVDYLCSGCGDDYRYFMVNFFYETDEGEEGKCLLIRKVGQFPAWSIAMDKTLENELGEYASLYKRGLENESQGYGVGAFAYFRRITEAVIDNLLDSILDLLEGDERATYKGALERVKETRVTQEKINLVKDLLPSSLRPDGMNPLGILHSALSEGLHAETDEECLEFAGEIKQVLVYMINQVERSRTASKNFSENMRKILNKRNVDVGKGDINEKKYEN